MAELNLYFRNSCPYCQKVKAFIDENKFDVNYKDITAEKESYQALLHVGGKIQVPCLFIDGKPMYESEDIMTWLSENAKK